MCVQAALQLQQVKSTTGRLNLLKSRDLRHVVREEATAIQVDDNLGLKCSAWTVRRILLGVDWLVYTKIDCTYLSQASTINRDIFGWERIGTHLFSRMEKVWF